MSQFVVLGMHRSGTTLLTRVLDALGCYTGPESSFNPGGTDHPKGYWEYRDVWRIDEDALAYLDAAWDDPVNVDLARLPPARRAELDARVGAVVRELDAHRPWAIKDPRLCLLLPLWRPALSAPVCVFIFRRPLEVALSLQRRDGSPLVAGFAMWELYNRAALENSRGMPRVLVSHSQLLAAPEATIREMTGAIERLAGPLPGSVSRSVSRSVADAVRLVRPDLHRERGDTERENALSSAPQRQLLEQLQRGDCFRDAPMAPLSKATAETLRQYGQGSQAMQRLHRHVREITKLDAGLQHAGTESAAARAQVSRLLAVSVTQAEELATLWRELDALASAPAARRSSLPDAQDQSARRGRFQQELEQWLDRARGLAAEADSFLSY